MLLAFLGLVLAFVGLQAVGSSIWWFAPVRWLSRYSVFHTAAHFTIFACVVFLYPQERERKHLWWIVLSGGILIELVQIWAGCLSLTAPVLLDSFFDVMVDVAGAC